MTGSSGISGAGSYSARFINSRYGDGSTAIINSLLKYIFTLPTSGWGGSLYSSKKLLKRIEIKDQKEEIEAKSEEIERQRDISLKSREEIIDSINYAQRIQKAIFPALLLFLKSGNQFQVKPGYIYN